MSDARASYPPTKAERKRGSLPAGVPLNTNRARRLAMSRSVEVGNDDAVETFDMIDNPAANDEPEGLIGYPFVDNSAPAANVQQLGSRMNVFVHEAHGRGERFQNAFSTQSLADAHISMKNSVYFVTTTLGSGTVFSVKVAEELRGGVPGWTCTFVGARHVFCSSSERDLVDGRREWAAVGFPGRICGKPNTRVLFEFQPRDIVYPSCGSDIAIVRVWTADSNDVPRVSEVCGSGVDFHDNTEVHVMGFPGLPRVDSSRFEQTYRKTDSSGEFYSPSNISDVRMTKREFTDFWTRLFGVGDVVLTNGRVTALPSQDAEGRDARVYHSANTASGMSGGPVYVVLNNRPIIIGVHTGMLRPLTTAEFARNHFAALRGTDARVAFLIGEGIIAD